MRTFERRHTVLVRLLLIVSGVFHSSSLAIAQRPTANSPSSSAVLSGRDPTPQDPVAGILSAFDKYEVVAMDAAHGNKDLDDLILRLVRDPRFPRKVNDIVVECGNSLYQVTLDRYIAGEDVPLAEARKVWRDTSVSMCSVSTFYETLFPVVRRINQKLPPSQRLRVLAGDPPLDWSMVKTQSDAMLNRDGNIASVMEKEVLSKKRKALMLFGSMHLYHSNPTAPHGLEGAVQQYEKTYPRSATCVVGTMIVTLDPMSPEVIEEKNKRMASWPAPSLATNLKGTWLANVDPNYFTNMVDAYLYLGDSDLILHEPRLAEIFMDEKYMAELRRRAKFIGNRNLTDQTDPSQISDDDYSPFLFAP